MIRQINFEFYRMPVRTVACRKSESKNVAGPHVLGYLDYSDSSTYILFQEHFFFKFQGTKFVRQIFFPPPPLLPASRKTAPVRALDIKYLSFACRYLLLCG